MGLTQALTPLESPQRVVSTFLCFWLISFFYILLNFNSFCFSEEVSIRTFPICRFYLREWD